MTKAKKDQLVFGYGLGLISLVFAVGGIIKHGFGWPQIVLLVCAAVFTAVTAFNYEALKPGYDGWMRVAHLIGGVVTTVILSTVFFVMFAPIGLFFRLIGKDHLERRIDKMAASYWHHRPVQPVDKERCKQQF